MSELSVQVPVRNGGEPFRRFLESLSKQDLSSPWELIIADDLSSIPVETEFAHPLALLPGNCAVKVIRMNPGGNRPAARNAALEASGSPAGLLMDADLEFGPGLLRSHLELRDRTGADAVMGKRVNAWSEEATPWQRWMDSRAMGNSAPGPFPWKYFITGNISINCSDLRNAGGFDTSIDRYGGEDTEMGYRLMKAGCSFYWDPSLSVNHLDNVTVRQHSMKMLEYGGTGLKYTLRKHPGTEGLLGSNWLAPLFSRPVHLLPARLLARAALQRSLYRRVLCFAEKHRCPGAVYTYLSVGACLAGLGGKDLQL